MICLDSDSDDEGEEGMLGSPQGARNFIGFNKRGTGETMLLPFLVDGTVNHFNAMPYQNDQNQTLLSFSSFVTQEA